MYPAPCRVAVALVCLAASGVGCSKSPGKEASTPPDTTVAAPKVTTDSAAGAAELRGTDWRLVAVGEKPATIIDSARAAHIILQPNSKQFAGSGGCNRMFGVYELNGDALRFSGVGAPRWRVGMAWIPRPHSCPCSFA